MPTAVRLLSTSGPVPPDMDFSIEQSFTDLEPGTYELSAFSQGGDLAAMMLPWSCMLLVDGKELTAAFYAHHLCGLAESRRS